LFEVHSARGVNESELLIPTGSNAPGLLISETIFGTTKFGLPLGVLGSQIGRRGGHLHSASGTVVLTKKTPGGNGIRRGHGDLYRREQRVRRRHRKEFQAANEADLAIEIGEGVHFERALSGHRARQGLLPHHRAEYEAVMRIHARAWHPADGVCVSTMNREDMSLV